MTRLADIKTTEWMLINWGRWAYSNRGLSLYYPGIEPTERMRGGGIPEAAIEDSEALVVDYLISRLKIMRPAEHEALVLHYLLGLSYRKIAKRQKTHHRNISDLIQSGTMWIEGAIQGGAPFTEISCETALH